MNATYNYNNYTNLFVKWDIAAHWTYVHICSMYSNVSFNKQTFVIIVRNTVFVGHCSNPLMNLGEKVPTTGMQISHFLFQAGTVKSTLWMYSWSITEIIMFSFPVVLRKCGVWSKQWLGTETISQVVAQVIVLWHDKLVRRYWTIPSMLISCQFTLYSDISTGQIHSFFDNLHCVNDYVPFSK